MPEYVNCNICGKDDTDLLFSVRDRNFELPGEFNLVKCRECGLMYLNPRPTKIEINDYYPKEYGSHKAWNSSSVIKRKFLHSYYQLSFNKDLRPLKNLPIKGKMLDVGCGGGGYLKILNDAGWDTYGVDVSPVATEHARLFGLNKIFTGELQDANYSNDYFDVVLMRHSLEHMHDPLKCLNESNRILKINGTLMVVVPNMDSLEAKLFGEYWSQIDAPRHLYFFNKETLKKILEKANFKLTNFTYSPKLFLSFSKSLIYRSDNKFVKKIISNAIFHVISYILFWPLHRKTSIVVFCSKNQFIYPTIRR
ncbi:Ubiquinone biosynthesis O-methyltransferase, mitochondrial [subsurface metagenome]